MVNMATKPMANSIGVRNRNEPFHMVPIQLKIFTPVGTAMSIVDSEKADTATGPRPTANMWCTHTPQPMKPMAMPENTMTGYPNSGLRENTGRISDTMPMAGRMRMYTSGWPNSQNRCCHSSGSPPAAGLKKFDPKSRSNISRNRATVMTGMANSIRNCDTSVIHMKIGMRNRSMPGARMLRMVTMRLAAPAVDAMPRICRPNTQKSMLWPGRNAMIDGVGGVAEPAAVGRAAEEEARVQEQAAEQEHPVAEGVQAREGDVAGADLQRHEVVEERRTDSGMTTRKIIVVPCMVNSWLYCVGRQDRAVGLGQLQADQQRLEAADAGRT